MRLLSFLLSLVLCFGLSLNANAADGSDTIKASDMALTAMYVNSSNDDIDCTSQVTTGTYHNSSVLDGMYFIRFPMSLKDRAVCALLTEPFSINSEHEYNLDFDWGYTSNSSLAFVNVLLSYVDNSGKEIKQQLLYSSDTIKSFTVDTVDIDFKPDVSDISGGYKCKLVIQFYQISSTTASEVFCVSPEISLTDKDDNSGWFAKIIAKIQETIDGIKQIPQKINEKLTELKDGIGSFFSNLIENLQNAFSDVGNWFAELGNKINLGLEAVGDFIVDGIRDILKWAFVPSEDFMDSYIAKFREVYEEHFGVFAQVTLFITDTLDYINDLINYTDSAVITFPEVSVPIAGKKYVIISETDFDLNDLVSNNSYGYFISDLYSIYQTSVWAIIILLIFRYAVVVERVILTGTSSVFADDDLMSM